MIRAFAVRQLVLVAEAAAVVIVALALIQTAGRAQQAWAVPVIAVGSLVATAALLVASVRHAVALARYTVGPDDSVAPHGGS